MKKVLLIFLLSLLTASGYAKKIKAPCPVLGTWKYTNSSMVNDFQHISRMTSNIVHSSECFVFEANHVFKHNFLNDKGVVVKSFKGKWKIMDGKINITYTDIDFKLQLNYFFLDKDLVLGQHFNHIIFTKDVMGDDLKIASK